MEKITCLSETRWDNGNLKKAEILYDNNVLVVKDFFNTGSIWQFTTYNEKEIRHGMHAIFSPSGIPKVEEFYDKGIIVFQKTYNPHGQQLTLDNYQAGVLIRRTILMVGIIEF